MIQKIVQIINNILDAINPFNLFNSIKVNTSANTFSNANLNAILKVIRTTEGTEKMPNPYAVVFGYGHTIKNFSDHPSVTGEWNGKLLPASMCNAVGLSSGCKSTASGAYQFIKPTWNACKSALNLKDFSKESQDRAAVYLIQKRGAYNLVLAGKINQALKILSKEWASLPYSTAGQPKVALQSVLNNYKKFGGVLTD